MPSLYHSGKPTDKRKKEENFLSPRKKVKTQHLSLDNLPWKSLHRPGVAGFNGDDGILELEEVEGVEVVYEETEGGRVARFNVSEWKVISSSQHSRNVVRLSTMLKNQRNPPVI